MRGTFFQKPLELNLIVDGETWPQGALIAGSLKVKNHGSEAVNLSEIQVHLAHGTLRKVRQKTDDAFKVISTAPGSGQLSPGATSEMAWKFQTEINAPISDNTGSLFLLYGRGANLSQTGQLQLPIVAHPLVEELVTRFQVGFRFVPKSRRASKSGVEIKLGPPSGKSFATLDHLAVTCAFEEDKALTVKYVFNVKKVDTAAAGFEVMKHKRDTTQTIAAKEYQLPSGRYNLDLLEEKIRQALGEVEAKIF